ncbi:MAG TPA: EVE domain-containing protein [Polyangiaceae bacterium]|nr:EVE domain-containing protein [Polyangiaceae bacterium]
MAKNAPQYWLMKSEPEVYSIDTLAGQKVGTWEGVRNFQARNHLRAMKQGDLALFHHSSCDPPGIAGLMRIHREAYPDATQFDPKSEYYDAKSPKDKPRWDRVDVEFVEKFSRLLTLAEVKADPFFDDMLLVKRGMRLSVQPVSAAHLKKILRLAGAKSRADG